MGKTRNDTNLNVVNNKKLPLPLNKNTRDILLSLGITEKNKDSSTLLQLIEMFHKVLERGSIIVVTNRCGEISYANENFCHLVGLNNERVVGKKINECMGNQFDIEEVSQQMNNLTCKETVVQTKSGENIYLHSVVLPFLEDENVSHYLLFYQDITTIKQAATTLEDIYYIDPLTKLPNRQQLEKDLKLELQHSIEEKACAVFFLDLDRFKFFNDTMGHTVGDDLIANIANELKKLESESLSLYRFGGDEFTFLMRNLQSKKEIFSQAEKMLKLFKQPFSVAGNDIFLTASVGISISKQGMTIENLMKQADTAMHFAKERGKDTCQIYEPHMSTAYAARLKVEVQLRQAIDNNEFSLHYQPQIDLHTKQMVVSKVL